MSSRALEMLQTGEGADCVIEVVHQHQQDGQASKQQKKKVFLFAFLLCNLLGKFIKNFVKLMLSLNYDGNENK
jgi:hypothetical protein